VLQREISRAHDPPTSVDDALAQARLAVSTPQLKVNAVVLQNVTSQCKAVGPNDFEYFSTAVQFGGGVILEIHTSTDGSFLPDIDTPNLTIPINITALPSFDDPDCFVISDDTAGSSNEVTTGDVGAATVAPTGTLLAAAVAVPTYDMQKIESFYSAFGTLPTNINYTQMTQVTPFRRILKVRSMRRSMGSVPCRFLEVYFLRLVSQ
jgi:hypothetical protein